MSPGAPTVVSRLALTDFRCYRRLRLEVGPEPVVLVGANGAGKTNLLEALSFLAPGRGLRRAKLGEPDHRLQAEAAATGSWAVAAVLATATGPVAVGTGREAGEGTAKERRAVRIDGQPARGQKDLARLLSLVWVTPEMDGLFVGGAQARRRFLDRLVYAFDPEHAGRVAACEHHLRERARLLEAGAADRSWLDAVEDGIARHGIAVAAARAGVVARLTRAAAEGIGPFPSARLALVGEVDHWLAEMPALAAEERLRERLAGARSQDAAAGGTSVGPQKSDLETRFAQSGETASRCSTGEQKALLLSVLLALAREVATERGTPPVLLLDEVVAHLDRARRAALFDELLALGAQAWMTGTDEEPFARLADQAQLLHVFAGTVTRR